MMVESLFAQVRSLTGFVLENVINVRVCGAHILEESQCWGGPAPAFASIDGVAVLSALAVLRVLSCGCYCFGPFSGAGGGMAVSGFCILLCF